MLPELTQTEGREGGRRLDRVFGTFLYTVFPEKEKKRMEKGFSLSTDIRREKEGRLSL